MTNPLRGELVPGGLAMVVGCRANPEDIGKSVSLEVRLAPGDPFRLPLPGCFGFLSRISAGHAWLCTSNEIVSDLGDPGWCLYLENHLMPINPSADPLEITQQQECEV